MHAQHCKARYDRGFSLLEMGIVIVVIGLIAGGILIGQGMIRSAEVQSILSDFSKYQAATARFQSQFASLPGDMPDASQHWADAVNGDGDGFIDELVAVGGAASEPLQFWLHLQRAGELDHNMTGVNGMSTGFELMANVNAPASKIARSLWIPGYDASNSFSNIPVVASSNFFVIMGEITGGDKMTPEFPSPILSPAEAFALDHKIDNGSGATGDIIGAPSADCLNGTEYNVTDEALRCALIFLNAF